MKFNADHPLVRDVKEFHTTLYYPDVKANGKLYALFQFDRFDANDKPLDSKHFYVCCDGTDIAGWFSKLDVVNCRQIYKIYENGNGIAPSKWCIG